MKLNKVISPSGQVYLNNYIFRNDVKSVIMTNLKLNTQYDFLCACLYYKFAPEKIKIHNDTFQ